ncbi:MAG: mannose-1-phosphate guanylyltransferase/mannose-6-phosphate isomerase [Polymorphobacter sp.]|uniref:mannose-1-phosphate guanylyltransferase/mannose-6-phosphate isomerase n=1 Tax=Polymorphobacter sp. TaxID=1909290 RepID=UPI003A867572
MSSQSTLRPTLRPVILAGGSGTRLWPLSRTRLPKQLLAIAEPRSMLQATVARTRALASAGLRALPPLIIAGEALRRMVSAQMDEAGQVIAALLLEPEGRNTAPAIALAALWAMDAPDTPLLIMPSDHVIGQPAAFALAVATAMPAAAAGQLVTFGITPETPETGYGYIETGPETDHPKVHKVTRFVEKPDLETAQAYVAGGRHLWNGGIFLITPRTILEELARHAPAILDAAQEAMASAQREGSQIRPDATSFATAPALSIDHAVMEHTDRAAVVPVAMEWSDVGSWDALWQISERDAHDNALVGDAVLHDVQGCLIRVEPGAPAVAALGLADMVIVSMADAILVAPRARVQEVKTLADSAQALGRGTSRLAHHDWGLAETLDTGPGHTEQRLRLNPGGQTLLEGPVQLIAVAGHGSADGQRLAAGASRNVSAATTITLANDSDAPWQLIAVHFHTSLPA